MLESGVAQPLHMLRLVAVLLIVFAGYYFYNRSAVELPDPLALRMVARNARGGIEAVQVVAVHGNRWRMEAKRPSDPYAVVVVHDGNTHGASHPQIDAAKIDPRPAMSSLFRELKGKRPEASEQIDGRSYDRYAVTYNGAQAHAWVDPETKLPLRVRYPSKRGGFETMHYSVLPLPVAQMAGELFNTRQTTSLLAEHLRVR